jgi:hypothetical protein
VKFSTSVSYSTTRFVLPSPATYALAAVVRRLASMMNTWPTSTPARLASSSTSSRVCPGGSGRNVLKSGSSTTGPA